MSIKKITEIVGKGIVVKGDDIDTDRIIPARFLKEITFANMGNYAFYDERFDENGNRKKHPFNDEKFSNASILVVNKNFGCGSSREHAPQSIMRWGIKAIIGESFADIFAGNCSMLGIPAVEAAKDDIASLMNFVENNPQENIQIGLNNNIVSFDKIKIKLSIPESARKSLIQGAWDTTSLMLEAKDEIKKLMAKLPYLNGFENV